MEPYDPYPQPSPSNEPSSGLPEPAIDEPPRLDASEAFAVGRAIGSGWSAVKHAPLPMLVAGFLMALLDGSNSGNFNVPAGDDGGYDDDYDYSSELIESIGHPVRVAVTDAFGDVWTPPATLLQVDPDVMAMAGVALGALLCISVILIAFWVARSFVKPGVIRLHSHILQTAETQSVGVIFSGSDRFLAMLLWELLAGVIMVGVILVTFVPAGIAFGFAGGLEAPWLIFVGLGLALLIGLPAMLYVGLGLSLGAHAVTLENRSPIEALKRSWFLASGNRWNLFVFFFVVGLVQVAAVIVGVLLCCVGLFVTIPAGRATTDFALTESFLLFTRGREVSDYWKLWEMRAGMF